MDDVSTAGMIVKATIATSTAVVGVVEPSWGIAAAGLGSVAEQVMTRYLDGQRHNFRTVVDVATEESGREPEALLEAATRAPSRCALTGEIFDAAARTTETRKLVALGRSLVVAGAGRNEQVEAERLWVAKMAAVEWLHLSVLDYLAKNTRTEETAEEPRSVLEADLWVALPVDDDSARLAVDDMIRGGLVTRGVETGFGAGTIPPGEGLMALTETGLVVHGRFLARGMGEGNQGLEQALK